MSQDRRFLTLSAHGLRRVCGPAARTQRHGKPGGEHGDWSLDLCDLLQANSATQHGEPVSEKLSGMKDLHDMKDWTSATTKPQVALFGGLACPACFSCLRAHAGRGSSCAAVPTLMTGVGLQFQACAMEATAVHARKLYVPPDSSGKHFALHCSACCRIAEAINLQHPAATYK